MVAAWLRPACLSALTLDCQEERAAAAARTQKRKALDANLAIVRARMRAKEQVVERVLAGEMTLFEAAAWFGTLNTTPDHYPDLTWCQFPGRGDGEKLCRQVLSWAASTARDAGTASQADMRLCQLEEELARRLAQHGTVDLARQCPPGD
jgi:hypothetical protein